MLACRLGEARLQLDIASGIVSTLLARYSNMIAGFNSSSSVFKATVIFFSISVVHVIFTHEDEAYWWANDFLI